MKKTVKLVLVLTIAAASFFAFAGHEKEVFTDFECDEIGEKLRDGDVVFIAIDQFLFKEVAKATLSWTSHVGIAFRDGTGGWKIWESAVPRSKAGPLCDYLRRTDQKMVSVRRLRGGLVSAQIQSMVRAAGERMGVPYDFSFDYHSDKLFCSKFVDKVYRQAGVMVGKVQTFQELLDENPTGSTRFWQVYFMGKIPWERKTVTPHSQWVDPKFETVFENGIPGQFDI